jgi:oxygen-independent coproporphyrinogen-3 oxidase
MDAGELAIKKGYFLTEEDVDFRRYILDIACKSSTVFQQKHMALLNNYTFPRLASLAADGLIKWNKNGLELTPVGHSFIRNVCAAFDLHLLRTSNEEPTEKKFSNAI